jgi:hypothetical protein
MYHVITRVAGGFVTRGGKAYAFPDVDVTVTPLSGTPIAVSKIDLSAVGSDVIRVFLEAVGDQIARLPADPEATVCKEKGLECFDPTSKDAQLTADQFTAVNTHANKVDTAVGGAIGKAIRGVSWISLNNEAIAKAVETAVAVTARKAAEKFIWCYYACTKADGVEGLGSAPWGATVNTIPFRFRP